MNTNLSLDRDCDSVGLRVERFTDGDALMAYCHIDSGPTLTFMASLAPPPCKEGNLSRDHQGKYVCSVHSHNCIYDHNPYTWEVISIDMNDNNYGCN